LWVAKGALPAVSAAALLALLLLGLAALSAALGFRETLLLEEGLLSTGEDEGASAIDTLELAIRELVRHCLFP
jgi:hypothetical protein